VAVVSGGQIYVSSDSGTTWSPRESDRNWSGIASSADGTRLVAVVSGGQIYVSSDSGTTWSPRESVREWVSVASSADGTRLAAVVQNGRIYVSSDSGLTWSPRESDRNWSGIASSADGARLAATVNGGQIYVSSDSGLTWSPRESSRAWQSVASSADGTRLAAVVDAGFVYTYDNENRTPSVYLTLPFAGSDESSLSWDPFVVWEGMETCLYSYDGFVSTNTVSCLNEGSDISAPSSIGPTVLDIRGIDANGSVYSSSVGFNYVATLAVGDVSSCGVMPSPGVYTLSSDIVGRPGLASSCSRITSQ
jgi:hypothetical protein